MQYDTKIGLNTFIPEHCIHMPKQPVSRGLIFATISLALLMMSIDSTIVATALHAMQHGLNTSINWVGWTLTAYSFGFVLMLPVSGKLTERYGMRRVFLVSVLIFTLASLCCGIANNIYVLIVLRALQAAGGAGFTPSATGIVVNYFGSARDRAVSLFGSIFPVGAMMGPIFGGVFVTYWNWRGVFLVNVPIGLAVLVMAFRYIPHDKPRAGTRKPGMDAVGMLLLGTGLLAGMLMATALGDAHQPTSSPLVVGLFVVAVASLWGFVRHISRTARPFIAPLLVHGPGFGVVNLINTLFGGVTQGVIALVPLYATNRYGFDALASGTLLTAQGIAALLLSLVAAMALRRTGYRLPIYGGSILIIIGTLLLASGAMAGISPYVWLACAAFLVGAGSGVINPACRNAGLQLAAEKSATIAALRSASLQIGSILTISIATAVLAGTQNPGGVQAWFYVATAAVILCAMPLVARVPEHHGSW